MIFAPGSLARLGECAQDLGGRRILLVTDPGLEHAGHPQRAAKSIIDAGLECFTFDGVRENPTQREVQAGVAFARYHAIDLIVAVGGGSSMDCAKGINFILTNGGRMADYKGHGKATKPMLPSIGVPTTAGTGSEAQSYALITDEATHLKMACGDKKAAFRICILDPEVTLSQPRMVTAVTGIDAISHALESFVSTSANAVSRMASLAAWRLLAENFEAVLADPDNLDARAAMQIGAHFGGMAIENSMLGVCHSCANPLTARYGITHGIAIGLMLPHVLRWNSTHAADDYRRLAHEVGLPDPTALIARLESLLAAAGMPRTLSEAKVDPNDLPKLAAEANQQWTARFNPRPITESDTLALYQAAYQ